MKATRLKRLEGLAARATIEAAEARPAPRTGIVVVDCDVPGAWARLEAMVVAAGLDAVVMLPANGFEHAVEARGYPRDCPDGWLPAAMREAL